MSNISFDLTRTRSHRFGGSMGLGLQMAEGLAEMGASLAICARKKERCEEAAKTLRSHGVQTLRSDAMSKTKRQLNTSWRRPWQSLDASTFGQ